MTCSVLLFNAGGGFVENAKLIFVNDIMDLVNTSVQPKFFPVWDCESAVNYYPIGNDVTEKLQLWRRLFSRQIKLNTKESRKSF